MYGRSRHAAAPKAGPAWAPPAAASRTTTRHIQYTVYLCIHDTSPRVRGSVPEAENLAYSGDALEPVLRTCVSPLPIPHSAKRKVSHLYSH